MRTPGTGDAMDWQKSLLGAFDNITALPVPRWLALTSLIASILLLVVVLWLMAYAIRMRGRLAASTTGDASATSVWDEHLPSVSLEGEGNALIDRLLPRRPRPFLLTVIAISIALWIVGLLISERPEVFLADTEWQAQPLYLAAHFVTLRMFATAFSRTFLAGASHLDISPESVRHRMWLVLGPLGALIAALISVPFSLLDYQLLPAPASGEGPGRATDLLVFAIWCIEWFLLAFIWVMVVGYMVLASSVIANHRFRDSIEVVLHERRYRPFLQMSAQGATIVLGFWVINIIYALITGAVFSDYAGAVITLVLVVAGLVPPLIQLRAKVNKAVDDEMASLRRRVSAGRSAPPSGGAVAAVAGDARSLESRLDEALVLLRMSYLERLHGQLGQNETTDIVIKLLVPATTMVWYGYKYYKGMP
jgi:hypothetical protein